MSIPQLQNDTYPGTSIHQLLLDNENLEGKLSTLRRLFASLVIGIVSGEDDAVQDDITLIEEVLTSD